MPPSGILLVDKPAGPSSAQVLNQIKRRLNLVKIGHAGTLDPFATGLLVCLVGKATKLAGPAGAGDKIYSGVIRLGLSTRSDDITGEVISSTDDLPDFQSVLRASSALTGTIMQVPPQVSAVKVNGERAYKLARRRIEVELKAREARVDCFELSDLGGGNAAFRIRCSKGTYVRALARDLGQMLGCGACLAELRRERSEPFDVSSAKLPQDLQNTDIFVWQPEGRQLMEETACQAL